MNFRIAPKAVADIAAIAGYLNGESPVAADGFEQRLQRLFATIQQHPLAARATNRRSIRSVNTSPYPYLVFYHARADEIVILRVMHGARNPRSMPARPR